jgi:hypothetical protein
VDTIKAIQACGHHDVQFEVDATRLECYFGEETFDEIQFNFPHVKGKTNAKRNRTLVNDFFQSSARVLKRNGHVHVALMTHQGGAFCSSLEEWKQSWMPARVAANHGLLLTSIKPFEVRIRVTATQYGGLFSFQLDTNVYSLLVLQPSYQLSSYRGEDRTFGIRGKAQLYMFENTPCRPANEDVQLFCHFNVYLFYNDREQEQAHVDDQTLWLQWHVEKQLPTGWRGHVSFVRIMKSKHQGWIVVYKICFFGESTPILQSKANELRIQVQNSMVADDKIPLLLFCVATGQYRIRTQAVC